LDLRGVIGEKGHPSPKNFCHIGKRHSGKNRQRSGKGLGKRDLFFFRYGKEAGFSRIEKHIEHGPSEGIKYFQAESLRSAGDEAELQPVPFPWGLGDQKARSLPRDGLLNDSQEIEKCLNLRISFFRGGGFHGLNRTLKRCIRCRGKAE
jgi:hypothetical protein